jgi:ribose 5-phosphate isomerase A
LQRTAEQAVAAGIPLSGLDDHPLIDLSIDGADEVDPDLNLVKGRGGALLREKLVDALGGSGLAMPVEVVQFCWKYNAERLKKLPELAGCEVKLRMEGDNPFVTDNSNYIIELYFKEPIKDAKAAANAISSIPGVVGHGLFLDMATHVIIASVDGVTVRSKHS